MVKITKSVGMLLFLSSMTTGMVSAIPDYGINSAIVQQQDKVCKGVVLDATGLSVIGASVVVKGTTNGSITGLDGDFSFTGDKTICEKMRNGENGVSCCVWED